MGTCYHANEFIGREPWGRRGRRLCQLPAVCVAQRDYLENPNSLTLSYHEGLLAMLWNTEPILIEMFSGLVRAWISFSTRTILWRLCRTEPDNNLPLQSCFG